MTICMTGVHLTPVPLRIYKHLHAQVNIYAHMAKSYVSVHHKAGMLLTVWTGQVQRIVKSLPWERPYIDIGEPDAEDASINPGPLAHCLMMTDRQGVEMLQVTHQPAWWPWHALQDDPGPDPCGHVW